MMIPVLSMAVSATAVAETTSVVTYAGVGLYHCWHVICSLWFTVYVYWVYIRGMCCCGGVLWWCAIGGCWPMTLVVTCLFSGPALTIAAAFTVRTVLLILWRMLW